MKFGYNVNVNVVFGAGRVDEVGEITAPYGKKALIVNDAASTKSTDLLIKVK